MTSIAPQDPLIGKTVAGRYCVLERVGDGGMGTVYRARQEPVGRMVALKVLLPELSRDELKMKRFVNEARILSQLRHPNTVSCIDTGQMPGGRLFIVMEFVHGGTLRELMDRGRLSQPVALRITRQILHSLAEAHAQGIIHRDLKPANVLLDEVAGNERVVRVADFGIAKFSAAQAGMDPSLDEPEKAPSGRRGYGSFGLQSVMTTPGVRLGTPAYIPPEQAFAKGVDHRADFYALGVMLYEMLAGHKPFESDTERGLCLEHLHTPPRPINSVDPNLKIDVGLEALLLSMMCKEVEGRPNTSEEIIGQIDEIHERVAPAHERANKSEPAVLEAVERPVDEDDEPIVMARSGPPGWFWGVLAIGLIGVAAAAFLR